MPNLGADELQNQKITQSATLVSQVQKTEFHMSSVKLGKIDKTFPGLMSLDFWCDIWIVGSELDVNNM